MDNCTIERAFKITQRINWLLFQRLQIKVSIKIALKNCVNKSRKEKQKHKKTGNVYERKFWKKKTH